MPTYQISFFKELVNSDGHRFRCLQGSLEIRDASSSTQATAQAERQFELLHDICRWSLHADSVDISEIPNSAPVP
jgi:hypothetical protein